MLRFLSRLCRQYKLQRKLKAWERERRKARKYIYKTYFNE